MTAAVADKPFPQIHNTLCHAYKYVTSDKKDFVACFKSKSSSHPVSSYYGFFPPSL